MCPQRVICFFYGFNLKPQIFKFFFGKLNIKSLGNRFIFLFTASFKRLVSVSYKALNPCQSLQLCNPDFISSERFSVGYSSGGFKIISNFLGVSYYLSNEFLNRERYCSKIHKKENAPSDNVVNEQIRVFFILPI